MICSSFQPHAHCSTARSTSTGSIPRQKSVSRRLQAMFSLVLLAAACPLQPPATNAEEAVDFRRQRVLNQTLLRNSEMELLLQRFAAQAAAGENVAAIELYQDILDQPADVFVWRDEQILPVSTAAHQIFSAYPSLRTVYERLHGAAAEALLSEQTPAAYRTVARRFSQTRAGQAALEHLIQLAWDRGDLSAAGKLWQRMLYQPERARSLSTKDLQQIWITAHVTNNSELKELVAVQPNWSPLTESQIAIVATIGQNSRSDGESVGEIPARQMQRLHWAAPRQQSDAMVAEFSPPLQEPVWGRTRDTFAVRCDSPDSTAARLQNAMEQWSRLQHEQLTPEVTTLFAIAVGDVLVYRDLDGVEAVSCQSGPVTRFETRSGTPLWRYESLSPLASALMYERDPYTGASTNHPGIDRLHLANSISNSLTTDGQRVFLVDGLSRIEIPLIRTVSLEMDSASDSRSAHDTDENPARLVNRLTALDLSGKATEEYETISPAWQIGPQGWQFGERAPEEHELSGHYFLGPPTVENGLAYVISEHDQYTYLSALDAAQGSCEWSLPISVVDRAIERDVVRATSACIATVASGMILCDTGNGQVVAVDSHLGILRWTYGYADEDARQDSGRWTYTQSTRVTQPGVLNTPVVVDNRVFLLPERSSYLHCCDLTTGELLWSRKREGLEYLAAIEPVGGKDRPLLSSNVQLLGVGDRFCAALRVEDGSTIWNTATRCISGHGIQVGSQFLLPVSDPQRVLTLPEQTGSNTDPSVVSGQILVLDINTGQRRGYSAIGGFGEETEIKIAEAVPARHAFPLGNLLASNNMIFAVGVNRILGFPQAKAVTAELSKKAVLNEADHQQAARAQLALGNLAMAKLHLKKAIQLSSTNVDTRRESLAMYRELLYEELLGRKDAAAVASSREMLLNELHGLAKSDLQQVRYLMTELELGVQSGDLRQLPDVLEQLAGKGLSISVNSTSETGHVATSDSWMPGLYHQICAQMSRPEQQELLSSLEAKWLGKLADCSEQQLTTLLAALSCPGHQPTAEFDTEAGACTVDLLEDDLRPVESSLIVLRDMLQIELIHRALENERWQEAELRLLRLQHSEDHIGSAYADQMLASLWSHLGLEQRATTLMQKLSAAAEGHQNSPTHTQWERYLASASADRNLRLNTFADNRDTLTAAIGLSGQEFVANFGQNHPEWRELPQLSVDRLDVTGLTVNHFQREEPLMDDPYRRKRLLHTLVDEDWMVLQQLEKLPAHVAASEGDDESDDEQHLLLLDRSRGEILHRIALPGSRIGLSQTTGKQAGHLLPIVVSGRILGISLIEGRPLWERNARNLQSITPCDSGNWAADENGIVRSDKDHGDRNHVPRVELGPVGVDFCIAQTSRALVCLDPVDGRLLWRRSDLDPQGGLWSDREVGILGDRQAVLYFHPDQNHYTMLDTRTGRVLRRGALSNGNIQVQRTRQPFGRHLMFLSVSNDRERERRIRVWDPLTDTFLVDEPFGVSALYHHSERDLAMLVDDQLRIYRPEEGRWLVKIDLVDQDLPRANYLRVSTVGKRYIVNLYQTRRTDEEEGYSSRYTDNPWDMTHLNGLVLAIDRASGELQWTRNLPHRSLVNADHAGLPFLLTCANFQAQPGAPSRNLLLEMLDPATGETIAAINDLPSARLLMLEHSKERQQLKLTGLNEEVVINYRAE